jgi:energy-coupling factor transporter ATP-binding protein EcfA2
MILNSLRIQNYKLLKDFEVDRLGLVNLMVGKNNSGKSTVLECLRIFASKGNPSVIDAIFEKHEEQVIAQIRNPVDEEPVSIYKGLFTDRVYPEDGSPIYIGSIDRDVYVEIGKIFYEETEEETQDGKGNLSRTINRKIYYPSEIDDPSDLEQMILIISNQNPERPILVSNAGRLPLRHRRTIESIKTNPISYIPTQFLSMDLLASLWDRAVLTPYFDNVSEFLKAISEDFEDIAFIKVSDGRNRFGPRERFTRTGVVKLKGLDMPVPLTSLGDGVLRALQLALGIYPAANGFLLIDEFENGLHYSVQMRIWKLIFKLASELSIQVFVTTHSWDCIESFSEIAKASDSDAILFRIGQSVLPDEKGKTIATVFDKDSLFELTQSDVELR